MINAFQHRYYYCVGFLIFATILTPIFAASFGAANIHFADVISVFKSLFTANGLAPNEVSPLNQRIVLELRLPRIVLAFVAGAGLSIAGSVLQTVTRNPLADPYLFGISSGASFGAVLVISLFSQSGLLSQWFDGVLQVSMLGDNAWWSWSMLSLPLGAFIGASLSVLIVVVLSGFGRSSQVERMLLSGVATSFLFGALTSLLLYFSSPQAAASVLFWSLGSFAKASWAQLWLPSLTVTISLLVMLAFKRQIMALQAGDESAHTLGVNVAKLRLSMLLLCSLITAVLVASCGGIGFVGLMIPHTVRLLFSGRQPMVLTAVVGGLFMVWIDVVARCLLTNQELPVGIITAALGSVFFLFILRHRR
ncbi:iron ABC transporter permease [Shewanella inventionis]|uniref:ABC transporter permease n=1 Tax=Shewanella inventionis TaxID=1738770 RepID=A0ABQ1JW95_9GAMM|nr:iron ABC transporter permease [Shewanella inventionis]MCL1159870.1 iron ABC transporter permease [Shewanella inventionis]UAL44567.1 iron ABC transporter permease [Shewanella inventionis]GGB75736.1 ABC transporter permease [Shewanella inventionis]